MSDHPDYIVASLSWALGNSAEIQARHVRQVQDMRRSHTDIMGAWRLTLRRQRNIGATPRRDEGDRCGGPMSIKQSEFANACRRSRDEMVRAINAANDAAASSHRRLSVLHAAQAVTMMSHTGSVAHAHTGRLGKIIDVFWLDGSTMH